MPIKWRIQKRIPITGKTTIAALWTHGVPSKGVSYTFNELAGGAVLVSSYAAVR